MIKMEVRKIPKFSKLTKTERILITRLKTKDYSNKRIAKILGRSVSTIGREIKRNSFTCYNRQGRKRKLYEPLHAQARAETRKQRAWRAKQPLKNPKIYAYVLEKLRDGWSPEQITGRLRLKYPSDKSWWISPETIYRFIYHPDNKTGAWWEYLRRKQKRRRKKKGRKAHRVRIPDRVSIHKRPRIIERRKQIGHWEGDSIVGKNHINGLHTEYERVSSIIKLEKLDRINAEETISAQKKIFGPLPKFLRRSTTLDNGLEMVKHFKLKEMGMKTYFADPYASWQRGGNENANLWVRYYFPKGTDFSKISQEELKDVEWELNNRPRKRLKFKTPMEVFTEHFNR
jgi:transposase, IS30 family